MVAPTNLILDQATTVFQIKTCVFEKEHSAPHHLGNFSVTSCVTLAAHLNFANFAAGSG